MLVQKVKDNFEKYSEFKILFLFDPKKEYEEDISNWNESDITIIKVDKGFFHLKYRLEFELADKKVLLYFNCPKPTGNEIKTFPLMDLMTANRVLQIDDVEDLMDEYNLKPYQRPLVEKFISHLKNRKAQKTLSIILKADSFENENQIKKGLICHFLGFNRIEEETVILAKLFTTLQQKNKELFSV